MFSEKKKQLSLQCSEAHSPVCGSDGMTYDNECQMVVAACATKTTVTVERQGACG